jgi:NDMA-dependent alcohol dehydrogenase
MLKTRAAVLTEVGQPIQILSLDLEPPRSEEVLVKIQAAGVCHSDWHVATGSTKHPLPVVLGHEGAGLVEDVGAGVTHVKIGDTVILNWAPSCGTCFYCARGNSNLCDTFLGPVWAGAQLDGSTRLSWNGEEVTQFCALGCFSERVVVPASSCIPVPAQVPPEIAALIGCAVTTGIGSVLHAAQIEAGSVVAVLGAGGVGLSTILGAVLAGASEIVAIDPLPSRQDAAIELGATHAVGSAEEALAVLQSLTQGRGADFAFEASGATSAQEIGLSLIRPGGAVVFTGLAPMGSSTNLPGSILVRQEKTVKGSYYGSANPPVDFLRIAVDYLEGRLPLDRLISHRYQLNQVNEAYADMLSGTSRRGVIKF